MSPQVTRGAAVIVVRDCMAAREGTDERLHVVAGQHGVAIEVAAYWVKVDLAGDGWWTLPRDAVEDRADYDLRQRLSRP